MGSFCTSDEPVGWINIPRAESSLLETPRLVLLLRGPKWEYRCKTEASQEPSTMFGDAKPKATVAFILGTLFFTASLSGYLQAASVRVRETRGGGHKWTGLSSLGDPSLIRVR